MKHLIAWTLAATVLLAPARAADEPNGTRMLIDALVQVEEVENTRIDRLPPRFVLTWQANPADIHSVEAIPTVEYEARLEALQPVIEALIKATEAPDASFRASLVPAEYEVVMLPRSRRLAPMLLIADAERLLLSGNSEQAAARIASALRLCSISLQNPLKSEIDEPNIPGALSINLVHNAMLPIRQTLNFAYPTMSAEERAVITNAVEDLVSQHAEFEHRAPWMLSYYLFEFVRDIEQLGRYGAIRPIRLTAESMWSWIEYNEFPSRLELVELVSESTVNLPLIRAVWWPGIGSLHASASIDANAASSLHRYAHACIRGDAGHYGIAVQRDASVFRMLCRNFFSLTDDLAAMRDLLGGHRPIPAEPEPPAGTFSALREALNTQLDGAERGSIESTKRAAQLAAALLDFAQTRGVDSIDDAERLAMLRDLENLRPDDPLRFEAISRRVAERMYLDMHHQIENEWTTRERFRDHAPEWFEARGVPNAAAGVQQVIDSVNADQDFQNRLHDFARGWLASELHQYISSEISRLRYPADETPQRWDDDEIDGYLLHHRGPMAAYLPRDWFDDLVAVHKGTRALWELRELLEENPKNN